METQTRRDISRLAEYQTQIAYQAALEETIGKFEEENDLNARAERLSEAIMKAIDQTIPLQERINKKWITSETMSLVHEKRQLKTKRDRSDEMEKLYKMKCNEVRKAARTDKAKWLENQCKEIGRYHAEFKTREAYKMIKNINRTWQPKTTAIKDVNGKVLMNTEEIVQRWTEYCSGLYQTQLDQDTARQVIKELTEIAPPREDRDNDILEEEIRKAVKRMKNNRSPGLDGVVGEMIKYGGEGVIKELHQICKIAYREGRTPEEWKKSVIIVLHKKGNAQECSNYRTIALMSHLGKVLMSVLTERLRAQTEEYRADEQAGFRKGRSTIQQILTLRLIGEKARRKGKKVYNCFVDFQKAFDSIDQSVAWAVMDSYGIDSKLVRLLKEVNSNAKAAVRVCGEIGPWFNIGRGTRQGDPISPDIFITLLERVLDKTREKEGGVKINGESINNLCFADDIDLIDEDIQRLESTAQELSNEGKRYGLVMNFEKTKTMVFGAKEAPRRMEIDGNQLENVEKFTYLGCIETYDLDVKKEVWARIAKATAALKAMDKVWKSKSIHLKIKLEVLRTCVFSSMLYGCETWTVTKEMESKILAFERKCYRKVLGIGWMQKMTNSELYARIEVTENLMQIIITRKLELFGHICRMGDDRKIKTVVFGRMEGVNVRGRPHKEWLDNITEWCEAPIQDQAHAALDRRKWRGVTRMAAGTYGHWSLGS